MTSCHEDRVVGEVVRGQLRPSQVNPMKELGFYYKCYRKGLNGFKSKVI